MKVKQKKRVICRNKLISLGIFLLLPVFANANTMAFHSAPNQPNFVPVTFQKAYFHYYGRHWHRPLWVNHSYHDYYYDDPEYYAEPEYDAARGYHYYSDEVGDGVSYKTSDVPQYYGYGYNNWHWISGHWVYRSYYGWKWVPAHWERS